MIREPTVTIFTIGFTKKSARRFFHDLLEPARPARLIDTRRHNSSQLAGFAKAGKDGGDLAYFLRDLLNIDYHWRPELAPSAQLLDDYRKRHITWSAYEQRYTSLLDARRIADCFPRDLLDGAVLLCSEHEPDHCHRRLAAEYFQHRWGGVEIVHLL